MDDPVDCRVATDRLFISGITLVKVEPAIKRRAASLAGRRRNLGHRDSRVPAQCCKKSLGTGRKWHTGLSHAKPEMAPISTFFPSFVPQSVAQRIYCSHENCFTTMDLFSNQFRLYERQLLR
jgi:hypothetical protein